MSCDAEPQMFESAKAVRRRFCEEHTGGFAWSEIFKGSGLDVGSGDCPLPYEDCRGFDQEQGDANKILDYFQPGTFNFVHASQCLEHLEDPANSVAEWLQITQPGGHVIVTVPDFTLYEQLHWPSVWNPAHESTWSMSLPKSPAPIHCYLPAWLGQFEDRAKIVMCRVVDTNYDYALLGKEVDQTFDEAAGVEAFIEFVLRK